MEKEIKGVLLRVGGFEYEIELVNVDMDIGKIEKEFRTMLNNVDTLTLGLVGGGSVNLGEGAVRSAVVVLKY